MRTLRRSAALAAALCALAAQAGLKITNEVKRKGQTSTFVMQLEGKNLRFEATREGSAEPGGAFIADGEGKRVLVIDFAKKEYHEITQEQMKQVKAKLEAAKVQLKEQMAKLPPEQRARMEAMMGQRMMGGMDASSTIPEEKYVRASGSKKIAGYSCDLYTVESEGKHVADTCLIPWADLKIDREALRQSMEALQETWSMGGMMPRPAMSAKAWGMSVGLPAWRKSVKENDEDVTETTLVSLSQGAVPKEAFAAPAGFARKSFADKLDRMGK